MAKILLADDDGRLCDLICDWLSAQNHVVDRVANGKEALELLKLSGFDLLIIDWDMPIVNGISVCKTYRSEKGSAPIIMLTGKTSIDEKEQGFECGADDYLTKPFDLRELSARIRALLRRPTPMLEDVLRCRDLLLDVPGAKLVKDGQPIELFPKEFALLEFFMRHANEVFSIETLQQRIWASDSEASPETIRVHIARLRGKIEDKDSTPLLRTVHKRGYIFDTSESCEDNSK